ncbi:MAG: hypothetical protein IJC11_04800 [Alphaproteobacteria bacterium]|nr:hypothetical protein [Alphaproteobacteria bacterium]
MQNKVNEFGRSMVEILGVLAVVGVLSITAIAGYKYAMEKYQAKQLCTSCSNHRVMQTGTNTYACVLICEDGDWQDISGKCRTGISTIDNEIGIDITSQQLCKNANGDISQDGEKLYCIPK